MLGPMVNDRQLELEETGRLWLRRALSEPDLDVLSRAANAPDRPGARLGWNTFFEETLGPRSQMSGLVRSVMPNGFPVRLIAFNKTPKANWSVPWHQDRVVAVQERCDIAGFVNWSQKAGTWHAEPPVGLLERMVFARIHLDDTDASNGCLELALGTHHLGLVRADEAAAIAEQAKRERCIAARGDVLLVKALTLHRSLPSRSTSSRRALRVDYADCRLAPPLEWAIPVPSDLPMLPISPRDVEREGR